LLGAGITLGDPRQVLNVVLGYGPKPLKPFKQSLGSETAV